MKIEVLHKPSFAIANITLDNGEEIITETNSMVSMSADIEIATEVRGGILKGIARMVMGGEGFFTNRYISNKENQEINLAPRFPGDIEVIDVRQELFLRSGSFLASDKEIDLDISWGGAQTFFSNEGLFLLKVKGEGKLILSGYGGIYKKSLKSGEKYIVDTGHVIAFASTVKYSVKPVGGLKQTLFSGEGLIAELEGEGDVYIQTRNEEDFISWIMPHINKKK